MITMILHLARCRIGTLFIFLKDIDLYSTRSYYALSYSVYLILQHPIQELRTIRNSHNLNVKKNVKLKQWIYE